MDKEIFKKKIAERAFNPEYTVNATTRKEKFLSFAQETIEELMENQGLSYRAIAKILSSELNENEELRNAFSFKKSKENIRVMYITAKDVKNFIQKRRRKTQKTQKTQTPQNKVIQTQNEPVQQRRNRLTEEDL